MNVRMMLEFLVPGVKDAEESDLRAEVLGSRVAIAVSIVLRTVTPSLRNARKFLAVRIAISLPSQLDCLERSQHLPGIVEVSLVIEVLKNLGKHQVTNRQKAVGPAARRVFRPALSSFR